MPLSNHLSLTFDLPIDSEESLKGYLLMNFDVQGFEESSTGLITVYLLPGEWTSEAVNDLQTFLSTEKKIELVETKTIEDKDWNAAWEAEIEPVKISDELVITPSWKIEEAKKNLTLPSPNHKVNDGRGKGEGFLIIIDPKMSFGTGHHETTRLCLNAIEKIDCIGKSILDIGTGTGALAMYALLRGAEHAVGIDTDEWSYANAVENREKNSFPQKQFDIRQGDLKASVAKDETFDIIFANIHRNILLAINKAVAAHHKKNGSLILSGILEYDADEIISAYEQAGYAIKKRMQENEWIALEFEKR